MFCSHLRGASLSFPLARHGSCHRYFQLSHRIFESFYVILVIRINEANSSQSSSIVEFWLLVFPLLFFSILSGFTNFCSYFWPYMIWSACRLNLCQPPPGPHIFFWKVFLSIEYNLYMLSKNLTNFCSNRHSSSHRYVFLA